MIIPVFLIFIGLVPLAAGKETTYVPEIFTEERYQQLWLRKPFNPPSPTAAAAQTDGIGQRYALSGLLKIGNDWTAFIQDRKSLERHAVSTVTANESGLQLVSVKDETTDTPIVTLQAGQQVGVIGFEPGVTHKTANPEKETVQRAQDRQLEIVSPTPSSGATPSTSHNSHHRTPIQTLDAHTVDLSK